MSIFIFLVYKKFPSVSSPIRTKTCAFRKSDNEFGIYFRECNAVINVKMEGHTLHKSLHHQFS